jgi:hypothetical protein
VSRYNVGNQRLCPLNCLVIKNLIKCTPVFKFLHFKLN